MDGFKDSTRMKYMTGGTYNEKGKRATLAEMEAEDRRMAGRPSEGVSTRPTDSSGRRMTNEQLGVTPGGVSPAKKKAMPKTPASGIGGGALAGAAAGALAGAAARAAAKAVPRGMGAMSDREMQMLKAAAKKPVKKAVGGSVSDKPMSGMPVGYGGVKAKVSALKERIADIRNKIPKTPVTPVTPEPPTSPKFYSDPKSAPTMVAKRSVGMPVPGDDSMYAPEYRVGGKYGPKTAAAPTRGPSMSPAFSDRPMIGRKTGGLMAMPKGKC
jgi:hypothetical protein